MGATDTKLASFTSLRLQDPDLRAAVPLSPPPAPDRPQSNLSLIAAEPALNHPVTPADFIRALHFPNNDQDKEGFRALRAALEDPATRPLIRAAQDVLTLLSQDGIFMDDLNPDRARPEIWRKFAKGERGRAIASLAAFEIGLPSRFPLVGCGKTQPSAKLCISICANLIAFSVSSSRLQPMKILSNSVPPAAHGPLCCSGV